MKFVLSAAASKLTKYLADARYLTRDCYGVAAIAYVTCPYPV